MTKWEYKRVEGHGFPDEELNDLGLQGWEIVATISGSDDYPDFYILKREIPEVED
jgi:hypothetical protein